MKLRFCVVFCFVLTGYSVEGRAQGLLDQMFRAPAAQDEQSATPEASTPKKTPKPHVAAKPKPPKKAVWRAPVNPPLPPARPWGEADASDAPDDPPTGSVSAAVEPVRETHEARTEARGAAMAEPPHASRPAPDDERSMVFIVRDGVRGPQDLEGRRVATGLSDETPDAVQRMVEKSAGVNVSAVAIGWSAGLASLARGEIDGVLLSLGPRIAARETEGVTLAGYLLLEIPVGSDAR